MEFDERIRSLFVVYLSVVLFALGNSIAWSGMWPYLNVLDTVEPKVTFDEYGYVVAADAAAQVIFSPIFGVICDKMGRIRPIALLTSFIFVVGNLFYANIALIPADWGGYDKPRIWWALVSRFLVGTGTSLNAAGRLYVAKVTTLEERTTHTSLLSLGQSLGLIAGPAIQAAVTPLGEKDVSAESTFSFDMYTIIGYISGFTGVVVFICFLPGIFVEYNTPFLRVGEKAPASTPNPDKTAAITKAAVAAAVTNGGFVDDDGDKNSVKETKKEHSSDSEQEKEEEVAPKRPNVIKFASNTADGDDDSEGRGTIASRGSAASSRRRAPGLARQRKREMNKQYSRVSLYSTLTDIPTYDPEEKINQWPDWWATSACIGSFFCFFCGLVTVDTLTQPISAHQFGWEDDESLLYVGLLTASNSLLAVFCFAFIGPLSRRIDERLMMIIFGIIPMALSRALMMPMSSDSPPFICAPSIVGNCTLDGYDTTDINCAPPAQTEAGGGCPFCWCLEQPQVKIPQYVFAMALGSVSFPFCIAIIASILAKGLWMGVLTTAGGCARVLGPIVFARTYQDSGLYLTLGMIVGIILLSLIINIVSYRRYKTVCDSWLEWEAAKATKPEGID